MDNNIHNNASMNSNHHLGHFDFMALTPACIIILYRRLTYSIALQLSYTPDLQWKNAMHQWRQGPAQKIVDDRVGLGGLMSFMIMIGCSAGSIFVLMYEQYMNLRARPGWQKPRKFPY
jgi:hypothetical protein